MPYVIAQFCLKLITLAGSTATTLWLVSFVAFEALVPYRWELLGWGFAAVAVGEFGSYLLGRYLLRGASGE
jgi:hypothetical protein